MESKKAFKVDGIETVVFDEGDGPPLVMLHGMLATSDCWHYTFDDLRRDYRVIAPDLPGYGRTDGWYQPYSLRFYTHWLAGLLEHLSLDRVTLIGHSMGGAISVAYTLDNPDRVDRLVLVDGLGMNDRIPWLSGWRLLVRFPHLVAMQITGKFDPHLFRYVQQRIIFDPRRKARSSIEKMASLNYPHWPRSVFASISLLLIDFATGPRRRRFTHQLESLTLPTLITWGRHDGLLPVENACKGKQHIPHAQLKIFENSAHLPMLEEPELFNQIIRHFLTEEVQRGRPKADVEA